MRYLVFDVFTGKPAHGALAVVVLLGLVVAAGCGSSRHLDSPNAGRTQAYEPGVPSFDMEAIVTRPDEQTGLDLYLSIPYSSLVFVKAGDEYAASFETLIRLLDRDDRQLVREVATVDTVRAPTYEATQAFRPVHRRQRLDVAPGSYIVEVQLTDEESGKQAVRQQAVDVVGPGPTPALSAVHLEGRSPEQASGFEPVISLFVPQGLDSLRASVHLHNAAAGDLTVVMRLCRFERDTTVASPPYWLSPTLGSLPYRGVRYDRADTLQVTRQQLRDVEASVEVAFTLPALEAGIYRIEVAAGPEEREGEEAPPRLVQQRDLLVTDPTFPQVLTLQQMVEAMAYIAYERERDRVKEGATPAERKQHFDAFWATLADNRAQAANLIELYYSRIEEANRLFTSFKEGWKTDRGMVYVMLGAPLYVENQIDRQVWHYSFSDYDPLQTFVFERIRIYDGDAFENYVLQRRPYYEQSWLRAMDRWRSGVML